MILIKEELNTGLTQTLDQIKLGNKGLKQKLVLLKYIFAHSNIDLDRIHNTSSELPFSDLPAGANGKNLGLCFLDFLKDVWMEVQSQYPSCHMMTSL